MNKNKIVRLVLVALLVSSLAGCGTYVTRIKDKPFASSADYYRGTKTVLSVLGFKEYSSIFCYATIVCPIVLIVSLPIDFLVDTLSLPYDYVYANRYNRMSHAKAMKQAKHGSVKFDFKDSTKVGEEQEFISYRLMYAHLHRSQSVFLDVDDAPLKDGVADIFIPGYEDYRPHSLVVNYGRHHSESIKLNFKRNTLYISPYKGGVRNDTKFYESGSTFIYKDDRFEDKLSQVYITTSVTGN